MELFLILIVTLYGLRDVAAFPTGLPTADRTFHATGNATFGLTHYIEGALQEGNAQIDESHTLRAWESDITNANERWNERDMRAAMKCLEDKFCAPYRHKFKPSQVAACTVQVPQDSSVLE